MEMLRGRRTRILSYVAVAGLTVVATLAVVAAANFANWGYLLPSQHGTYQPPGSGRVGLLPLSVNNTTVTLSGNGSWYAEGFQANASSQVAAFESWLNVSGGRGQLTVYNMTADEFDDLKANQTYGYEQIWPGITSSFIHIVSYVYATPFWWVFLNTGSGSITLTYNLNVVP